MQRFALALPAALLLAGLMPAPSAIAQTSNTAAATAARPPSPCLDAAAHPEWRQLDFWVGAWDVFNGDNKIADVTVTKVLNNCALSEMWKGRGGDGMGLSTYNQRTKKWEYFWSSDRAATSHFTGSLLPGEMRYKLEQVQPDGSIRLRHWSLIQLPGGKVRELSVASGDDGSTWTTEYDYTWAPKKP